MFNVTASIVLYNTSLNEVKNIKESFNLSKIQLIIYIIDNSPNDSLKDHFNNPKFVYISRKDNPGFGSSHNFAINMAIENNSNYHFVINPDIKFNYDVLSIMVNYMNDNPKVGMIMPQILNEDGTLQNLPKLLPSPWLLLIRKMYFFNFLFKSFLNNYELRNLDSNKILNIPILSGCFTLIKTDIFSEIGLYDEQFFMYFEDWDLSRRVHKKYLTLYFPLVSVFHGYESGANKNFKLFKIFIKSAFIYFTKWGWFFDNERKSINKKALSQII